MSEKEGMDSKQKQKLIIGIVVFVLAGLMFWYNYGPAPQYSTSKALFTDDDGATWYEDSIDNIPPYMHNGKEAVRINVYSYANGSKTLAGYLMKFPQSVKDNIEKQAKSKTPPVPAHTIAYAGETPNTQQVKAPLKKSNWEPMQSPAGIQAMTVKSPDGSMLDSVLPKD